MGFRFLPVACIGLGSIHLPRYAEATAVADSLAGQMDAIK